MRRPTFGGTTIALLFLAASLTPSLVPRHWAFQGLVTGIVTAAGYGLGTLGSTVARRVRRTPLPGPSVRAAWLALAVLAPVSLGLLTARAITWQQHLHRLMDMPEPAPAGYVAAVLLGLLLAIVLVLVGRGLAHAARRVRDWTARWLPPVVARFVGVLLVGLFVVGLLDGLVSQVLFDAADEAFRLSDQTIDEDVARPTSALRSGSPSSRVEWEHLGAQGRDFVAGGPRAAELTEFTDRPVTEPIRIYVGLGAAESDRRRAQLVVDELERTGAFERAVLCVVTTTGTGWVDPVAAAALEYLWAGDTALATMQYSYLPSWISLLVDSTRAREAGAELFNAVHDRWSQLPEDDRPQLVVFGESLGADGSEAAFSGIADLRNRTDGALWVGPPSFSELWRGFVDRRDPDTPERLPTYDGGATVRFAATPDDLQEPDAPWYRPRVVYLQQPSDPVVWWSPRLILRRPDWLAESQGSDVLPDMRWYPLVTFWQVTADLANAERVPPGHGHGYGALPADAWAAIVPPPGWTGADTARLRTATAAVPGRH